MLIGDFYYEIPKEFPALTVTSIYFVLFCLTVFFLSGIKKTFLRQYILLIANCIFIWSFSKDFSFLFLIALCTFISYFAGLILNKWKNNIVMIISISFFIALLIFYKYSYLLLNDGLLIPLGLSFYSFKIMSYLIDIYKGKIEVEKNVIYYFDYVMFFPCVTAGPINRANDFFVELKNPKEFNYKDVKNGGFQLSLGIFEKIVFCDYIALMVERFLGNNELLGLNVLIGIFLYSFQIYLDFDAVSNIAIGSARLLGFSLPKNFNSPYLSKNLKEFWNRWHISLSSWFKDYLYISLGGNKKGEARKFVNLVIVFVISGLWHGSTINFLLWGFLHGLIRIIEDFVEPKITLLKKDIFIIDLIRVIFNFIIVSFLWLFFKYQNFNDILNILLRLKTIDSLNFELAGITINELWWLCIVLGIVVLCDLLRNKWDMLYIFGEFPFFVRWIIYLILIIIFLIFGVYGGSFEITDFIYRFF